MKGDPKILDLLNEILTSELTAVNQYLSHARLCKNLGYKRLEEAIKKESVGEMRHADELIERIVFLDGLPNVHRLGQIHIGQRVPQILKNDLALKTTAVRMLNSGIKRCRDAGDNGTEALLTKILDSQEGHVDWIETQLELLDQVGEVHYLAHQIL
jgi:bacterioferritin